MLRQSVTSHQPHDLTDILRRAGSYVDEFQTQLAGLVAEESYVQELVSRDTGDRFQRRRLRSDLLLLRPEGAVTWTQFRDVFEVDGRPVRDRQERLVKLFIGDVSGAQQVAQIRAESARYNIGHIVRTMNVPVLPLAVLAPASQPRFRFTVPGSDRIDERPRIGGGPIGSAPNFRVKTEGLILDFEEQHGPTLVRTSDGADIFARGRFWLEPDTGRVLISEMTIQDARVRGDLVVSYQSEPMLGMLVPVELRERYVDRPDQPTITGVATYSNFRRFQVSTEQTIRPIR
jgi:hypothetical protein